MCNSQPRKQTVTVSHHLRSRLHGTPRSSDRACQQQGALDMPTNRRDRPRRSAEPPTGAESDRQPPATAPVVAFLRCQQLSFGAELMSCFRSPLEMQLRDREIAARTGARTSAAVRPLFRLVRVVRRMTMSNRKIILEFPIFAVFNATRWETRSWLTLTELCGYC